MAGLFSNTDGAITKSSTAGVSAVEHSLSTLRKGSKTLRKKRDGTDGIDAVDERDDHIDDRLSEGFEMMHGD